MVNSEPVDTMVRNFFSSSNWLLYILLFLMGNEHDTNGSDYQKHTKAQSRRQFRKNGEQ